MSDNNNAQTLDGRPAEPLPEGWGRPGAASSGNRGRWTGSGTNTPVTLGSLNREEPQRGPSPNEREGAEFYTGGERSGLAVQNPNEHGGNRDRSELVDGILRQAHSGSEERAGAAAQQRESWGLGHTLGSDEVESQTVGEVEENEEEVQRRTLTFWRDGFSIEDGDLYRYDDPANMQLLAAIQAGRAPVSLFNVNYDQALELVINERRGEMYSPLPKKPAAAFSGEGNRLGSAVPTFSGANTPTNASGAASPAPAAASSPAAIQLDASKPAANVQLRLGDGSRLVARVNLDHTVADLGAFIAQSHPDRREFILQTTFPSRELKDDETIEGAKLANAVVVQRYI